MTHITTGWIEGILTKGKLFSRRSSSFLYLERARRKGTFSVFPDSTRQRDKGAAHTPFLDLSFRGDGRDPLQKLLPELVKHGLVKLQPGGAVEVQKGQGGLEGGQ